MYIDLFHLIYLFIKHLNAQYYFLISSISLNEVLGKAIGIANFILFMIAFCSLFPLPPSTPIPAKATLIPFFVSLVEVEVNDTSNSTICIVPRAYCIFFAVFTRRIYNGSKFFRFFLGIFNSFHHLGKGLGDEVFEFH